jgi:plasmid replication initiation protein
MKKGKIIAYSVVGVGVSAVVYFLVKKMKSKKKALPDLQSNTPTEDIKFSEEVDTVGRKIRGLIMEIDRNRGSKDFNYESRQSELVTELGRLNSYEREDLMKWYEAGNFSPFKDLKESLGKILTPLWYDRAERTMWWNS